ncbi:hypothetical protein NPIL_144381 [Nephila pilipes]|uniref:Uncharacterized protein n=1 Tax=Nephila pilipes TaxID=299642 RepID=A0A8X6TVX2_NEPPI|nr:hypothetical protein NPIL_144381 [Nephila pilipes]
MCNDLANFPFAQHRTITLVPNPPPVCSKWAGEARQWKLHMKEIPQLVRPGDMGGDFTSSVLDLSEA